ncbi:hypothetical protein GGTG_13527 [Gaeumannomyces tritici R3-111a-1]|uniref:Uncharacterized protein n=1 Tax=Gaeumannomyces tritici (strain R3-111a-1) TaxID=644352 RepID=J3PJ44_GAET3|nr:hypothetical protein GGTG_13527 [Gaeumannomyces tritici R3-111a-1]EJT68938.1 hypothetical protein GGTG_13527 [Gaeumannomyces tritici R3-111a-1]
MSSVQADNAAHRESLFALTAERASVDEVVRERLRVTSIHGPRPAVAFAPAIAHHGFRRRSPGSFGYRRLSLPLDLGHYEYSLASPQHLLWEVRPANLAAEGEEPRYFHRVCNGHATSAEPGEVNWMLANLSQPPLRLRRSVCNEENSRPRPVAFWLILLTRDGVDIPTAAPWVEAEGPASRGDSDSEPESDGDSDKEMGWNGPLTRVEYMDQRGQRWVCMVRPNGTNASVAPVADISEEVAEGEGESVMTLPLPRSGLLMPNDGGQPTLLCTLPRLFCWRSSHLRAHAEHLAVDTSRFGPEQPVRPGEANNSASSAPATFYRAAQRPDSRVPDKNADDI